MNLLLYIKYPKYFSRVIVTGTDSVLPAIESTNQRIRMCENISALNKIEKMFSGQIKPLTNYIAGNNYFGKVIFRFTKANATSPKGTGELSVKVFSALGKTLEEHDERYKRLKAINYKNINENNSE